MRAALHPLPGILLVAASLAALPPSPAPADPGTLACSGRSPEARALSLRVAGERSDGLYAVPRRAPRSLVVIAHGWSHTSRSWQRHIARIARETGALAVVMDYRGLVNLQKDPSGLVRSRGFPARKGSQDLIAAARAFRSTCPSIRSTVLLGFSLGGAVSGIALAQRPKLANGAPLFDWWLGVEGNYDIIRSYSTFRIVTPGSAFIQDVERETGGPLEGHESAFRRIDPSSRVADIAASGVRGVVMVHARDDGSVLYALTTPMRDKLRARGLPVDLWSIDRKRPGDVEDTTLSQKPTDKAGHVSDVVERHITIETMFDRLQALLIGPGRPCDRDYDVDGLDGVKRAAGPKRCGG